MTPIQSVKNQHGFDLSLMAASNQILDFAQGVETGEPRTLGTEVPVGAKISRIFVSLNFVSATGGDTSSFKWYLAKSRSGQSGATDFPTADWSDIGLSQVRNQIFYSVTSQVGTEDAGPYKFGRWLKIPKIYQRMRAGDAFFVKVSNSAAGALISGFLYKYYT